VLRGRGNAEAVEDVRVASERLRAANVGGMEDEGSAFAEATPKAFARRRRDRGWRIDYELSSRRARGDAEGRAREVRIKKEELRGRKA